MIATNYVLQAGKTLIFNVACTNSDGTPLDLTGYQALFLAKRRPTDNDGDAYIDLNIGNGGVVVAAPATGIAQVQIKWGATYDLFFPYPNGLLTAETVLYWSFEIVSAAGDPYNVAGGLLTLEVPPVIVSHTGI